MEQTFIEILLPNCTGQEFLAYSIVALLGVITMLGADILMRKKKAESSPEKFYWKYWWNDNKWRLLITVFLVPIAILLIASQGKLSWETAFFIGFSGDFLSNLLKKKGFIKAE